MATQNRSRLQRIIYFLEGVADRTTNLQVNLILPEPMLSHYARASFQRIKFPVLQEIELDFRTNWNGRHHPRWEVCGFNLPEDAPNLRSVSMVDLAPALESTAISRLTRLVLDAPSFNSVTWPEQFWGALEQATALEYLELQSWSPYDTYTRGIPSSPPSFQHPRTIIPNLRQLVLRGFESPDLIYILLILNAPELSQVILELPGYSKRFNSGWDDVQVERPFNSVSSLDLRLPYRTLPVFHEQFPAFLTRLFPNIMDLSMPLAGSLSILLQLVRSWDRPGNSPQEFSRWPKLCRLSIVAEEKVARSHSMQLSQKGQNFRPSGAVYA
ncbi:hypothetical protein FRC00_010560 [Tulasnella sp. 408]|nr:hypothetical protein FRC00_010560 [Tulasnella sp. 408]